MPIGQMRQTVFSDDPNLSLFQQSVNDQFSQVSKIPFINGNMLTDIELTAGVENNIEHKLGRTAVGYFVSANGADSTIWQTSFTDKVIVLFCSAGTTVNLWVF